MKKAKLVITGLLIIFLGAGCVYAVRYDGPYKGRIIDAETGEALVGVVILGVWNREHVGAGGAWHTYYDARETVTDGRGEFEVPGLGIELFSNVEPMNVLIFKAGYEYLGYIPWESLKSGIRLREIINWEGSRAIIPLKKLTLEEREKVGTPSRPNVPDEKMKLITEEINRERIARGLKPLTIEK